MSAPTPPAALQLRGADRAHYFAPVAFCLFLAALCLALMATSLFLTNLRDALAITLAGFFGLLLTGGAAAVLLTLQRRWLRYLVVDIGDPQAAFAAIEQLAAREHWRIHRAIAGVSLRAHTAPQVFSEGEVVSVELRPGRMWLTSICDPQVGFSLVGHARCRRHMQQVLDAVQALPPAAPPAAPGAA
jgi:hypothetical protein